MTYAQDFLETWSGCDLIIGTSSRVPIKRATIEAIGAAIPISKGKEKRIKQEKLKGDEVEESAEGTEAKKRKTGKSQKQMVAPEEKEIGQPLTTRSRKKTKVESSFFQAPVTSSVHGPLGSSDFVSQSPLGRFIE